MEYCGSLVSDIRTERMTKEGEMEKQALTKRIEDQREEKRKLRETEGKNRHAKSKNGQKDKIIEKTVITD